jgi:preprotein translocase subunit SecF
LCDASPLEKPVTQQVQKLKKKNRETKKKKEAIDRTAEATFERSIVPSANALLSFFRLWFFA